MNLWTFLLLLPLVQSFTLTNIPSTISVLEPFTVDWTSDPSTDPVNITVIVFDATRTSACLFYEISHYELSAKAEGLPSGKGEVSFIAPHSGSYFLCAFSVTNADDPRSATGQSLFNSSTISATLVPQTVTVTASPSPYSTSNSNSNTVNQQRNHEGAIIGGTLSGFFALLLGTLVGLFWFGRYRIVPVSGLEGRKAPGYDVESERRAVENFTGVRSPSQIRPPGYGGDSEDAEEERPPSYDSVHASGGR